MEEHSGLTKLAWGAQCIHIFSVNFYQPLSTRTSSGKTSLIYFLSLQSMLCLSLMGSQSNRDLYGIAHLTVSCIFMCNTRIYRYRYRYFPIQNSFSSNLKHDQWTSANIHKSIFTFSFFSDSICKSIFSRWGQIS